MRKLPFILLLLCCVLETQAQDFTFLSGGGEPQSRRSTFSNSSFNAGAVWLNQPLSLNNDFEILYSINFGCYNNSGEGLAFILSQNQNVSQVTNGMGFLGLSNSIAVEFDMQQDSFDPNYDHAAILLNGIVNHNSNNNLAGPAALQPNNASIEDCAFHAVKLKWEYSLRKLTLSIDCNEIISHTFSTAELSQAFTAANGIYAGFTGSNFSGSNHYKVDWLYADFGLPARNVEICQGDTAALEFTGGNYSFDSSTGLINISPNSDTVQFFQQQDEQILVNASNGCGNNWSDVILVDVLEKPVVNLGADTAACAADTFWLDVSQNTATSYQWNTGHNGPQMAPFQTGMYSVTVNNSNCSTSDSMNFVRIDLPQVDLGNDTSMCKNTSFLLNAGSTGSTYAWNTGNASPLQEVNTAGIYQVSVSNVCGTVTDSVTVTTFPRISFDLGNDTTICKGDTILLDASTNGIVNYVWNNGSSASTQNVNAAGTYAVEVSNHCEVKIDQIDVQVLDLPDLTNYVDTFFCQESSINLAPPQDVDHYMWSVQGSPEQLEINEPGTYSISASNFCGESNAVFSVIELNAPDIQLGSDTVLCNGESIEVDLTMPFTTVLWSDGDTSAYRILDSAGVFGVSLFNYCGGSSDNIRIEYDSLPKVNLPESVVLCEGDSIRLSADIENVRTIMWNNGIENNNTITVTEPQVYTAEVANFCGTDEASTTVSSRPLPNLNLKSDTALCPGDFLRVDLSFLEGTVEWSNGNTGRIGLLQSPGQYSVNFTDDYGCVASGYIEIKSECSAKLFMPNAFTPNSDGLNDVFKPRGEWVSSFSMEIFNRWGELIHQSNGFDNGWSGENKPEGVYVWRIQYEDESFITHQLQGKVTLTRSVAPQP